ncbi:MAG: hypothetical protein KF726_24465 [Anaerolineae bacterium]|nr:hypothetical protein [Anaerolineae bacterium]
MSNYFDWPSNEPQRFDPDPIPGESDSELQAAAAQAEAGSEQVAEPTAPIVSEVESDEDGVEELTPMIGIVSAMMADDGELEEDVSATIVDQEEAPAASAASAGSPTLSPRIAVLSDAIERHPDAPANYVLRGEAYLELAKYQLAASDFMTALRLAADRQTDWEYLNRSVLDRARQGLRRVEIEG